jgi:hypothetical protein
MEATVESLSGCATCGASAGTAGEVAFTQGHDERSPLEPRRSDTGAPFLAICDACFPGVDELLQWLPGGSARLRPGTPHPGYLPHTRRRLTRQACDYCGTRFKAGATVVELRAAPAAGSRGRLARYHRVCDECCSWLRHRLQGR